MQLRLGVGIIAKRRNGGGAAAAPSAFTSNMWTVQDLGTAGDASITINVLPSDNGSAITALQYKVGAGAWTSMSGTGTGSRTVAGFTDGVATNVLVRAVNAIGNGADSDTKSVTTTSGATAPSAFTAGQWTLADATTGGTATLNITALPSNGGSAITALQYQLDGGTWLDLTGTGTGSRSVGGFTDGNLTSVNIRAVNSAGNGAASDTKTVTTTTAATVPGAFTVAMWDVQNAASSNDATINILVLPSDGNSPITNLEYRIGAAAWASLGASTTGSYTVAGFTDGVETNVLVRAVNAIGAGLDSDTKLVTTTAAPLDYVIDFVSGGSDRLQQDFAWTDAGGTLPTTGGVWLMGFAYYDGTNWSGTVISAGDPAAADKYFELNLNYVVARNSGQALTSTMSTPSSPGWYLCTAWAQRLNAGTFDGVTHFRNELTNTNGTNVSASITTWPRIGLGARILNSSTNHANFRAAGFAAGWGDPTALHAWLYNGGAFGRDIRNYPGDAGVTVRHYWVAARTGAATFDPADTALADVIGGADTWTQVGSPVWSATSPPFDASVVTSSVTSATVPSGATNTLVITSTIPAGVWGGTPTVDTSKIDIAVRKGMGPVNISGTSVNVSGLTTTTTLTLDRSVYASEIAKLTLTTNWLTVPSRMQSNAYGADITNSSADADPTNWPGISHGNTYGAIGWRFQTAVPAGYHADGIPWCQPCTITDEYPARSGGLNGAEMNPARRSETQKFDNRTLPYTSPTALPWTLVDKDTVIKARSNPFPYSSNEGTASQPQFIIVYGGLVCRASAPAANEFAPPLVWDAPGTRPAGPTIDVTALSFPTYSTSGHPRPTGASMIERAQIFDPSIALFDAVDPPRRSRHPTGITRAGGYPEEISATYQACGLVMIGDDVVATKREIAKGLIMHGTQWYDTIDAGSLILECDGGQASGFLLPMVLMLCWSGRTAKLATMETDIGTNELQQSFLIDSTLLAQMTAINALTPTYHAVGDYEWAVRGTAGIASGIYDPTQSGSTYRATNSWSGTLMTLRAFGFLHSSFANFQGVVRRAADQDYPSGTGWHTHHNVLSGTGGPWQWESAFWTSHRTAIDAVSQTVG